MTRRLIPAAALVAMLAGCSDSTDPRVPSEIELSQTTITLDFGQSTIITATVRDQHGAALEDQTVTWSSSNENVATVSNGEVTAVGAGPAQITATSGSLQEHAQVSVVNAPTSVAVEPGSLLLAVGQTGAITAVVRNESGDAMTPPPPGYEITWSSGSDAVATVDDGTVTAVASGQTTISAHAGDLPPGQVQTNVVQPHAVEVSHSFVEVDVDGSFAVTAAVVNPAGSPIDPLPAGYEVVWSSSDPAVATVGSSITGVALGEATISVTSGDLTPVEIAVTVGREYETSFDYEGGQVGSYSLSGIYSGVAWGGDDWAVTLYNTPHDVQNFVAHQLRDDGRVDYLEFVTGGRITEPGTFEPLAALFLLGWQVGTDNVEAAYDLVSGSVTVLEVTPFRITGTFDFTLVTDDGSEEVLDVVAGAFSAPLVPLADVVGGAQPMAQADASSTERRWLFQSSYRDPWQNRP